MIDHPNLDHEDLVVIDRSRSSMSHICPRAWGTSEGSGFGIYNSMPSASMRFWFRYALVRKMHVHRPSLHRD